MRGRHQKTYVGWGPDEADQMMESQALAMVPPPGPETWPEIVVGAFLTFVGGVTALALAMGLFIGVALAMTP